MHLLAFKLPANMHKDWIIVIFLHEEKLWFVIEIVIEIVIVIWL